MNEAGHEQRAIDIERSIHDLGDPAVKPYNCAMLIGRTRTAVLAGDTRTGYKLKQTNTDKPTRIKTYRASHRQAQHRSSSSIQSITPIPRLDEETEKYLRHVLTLLITRREDLLAAVLYGSVARQTVRALDDPDPSDVDVLLIFEPEQREQRVSNAQHTAISWAKIEVIDRYPQARELQLMSTVPDFAGWDSSFVENVAHDGILLWARGPLPEVLHPVEERWHSTTTAG
jgi:predicted nucleotidyltransferase